MPLRCQLMVPWCWVFGMEEHIALGMVPTPAGPVPVPFPHWWVTVQPHYIPYVGDQPSPDVYNDSKRPQVKRGHENKYFRVHLALPNAMPQVPGGVDYGMVALHTIFGTTKTAWGPFSVKSNITAPGDNPAVILIVPSVCCGPVNHMNCSDPVRYPAIFCLQVPNSVYAGMTVGDFVGCLVLIVIDIALDAIFNRFGAGAGKRIGRIIGRNLIEYLLTRETSGKIAEYLGGEVGGLIFGEDGLNADAGAEWVADQVNEWFDE